MTHPTDATRKEGHSVRDFEPSDTRDVHAVLSRAFSIDPMFDYFTRDLLQEHVALPRLFAAYCVDLFRNGRCWVSELDGQVRGFAGWLPPGGLPRGLRRELKLSVRCLPIIAFARHRVALQRLILAIDRRHPTYPHWYLSVIGIDPTVQGRGYGKALIEPGLTAARTEGVPCYLETQKESNLAWYARFGFEVVDTVSLDCLPTAWCLQTR